MPAGLDKSMLRHRVAPVITDDHVIEYADVHEGQQVLQPVGDEVIGRARLKGARWMVMREDDRRGVVFERLAQHISWVNVGAVHCTAEEFLERDEAPAAI